MSEEGKKPKHRTSDFSLQTTVLLVIKSWQQVSLLLENGVLTIANNKANIASIPCKDVSALPDGLTLTLTMLSDRSKSYTLRTYDFKKSLVNVWTSFLEREGAKVLQPKKSAFFASTSVETNSTATVTPSSETLFIENTYVEQWEGKHVVQWFNEIGFEILSPSFSAIDGPALLALTEEETVQRNLIPKEMIPEVYYAISSLKRTRKLSREVLTVVNKIRVIKSHEVPDDHFQLAEKLTIPESMIKAYFKMERARFIKHWKVNLVITEILHSSSQQQIRKMVAPLAHGVLNEYGIFHSAISVGPWYFDWNDSALCIPRKPKTGSALLSVHLQDMDLNPESVEEAAKMIATNICSWNVGKLYKNFSILDKQLNEANCQDFADMIISTLNISFNPQGAVANFLKKLKTTGNCDLEYIPNSALREKASLPNSIIFKSHSELDDFVNDLRKKNSMFKIDYPDDFLLLKSFDRAFWLRSLRQATPDNVQGASSCPFGDPTNETFPDLV